MKVLRSEPHEIELAVRAPAPGMLVSREVFYPGWENWLDGRSVETVLVNTAFLGSGCLRESTTCA